jgi:hypothetical protein
MTLFAAFNILLSRAPVAKTSSSADDRRRNRPRPKS